MTNCTHETPLAALCSECVEVVTADRDRFQRESARLNAEAATFCDRLQAAHEERDVALLEAANLAGVNIEVEIERDRLRATLATLVAAVDREDVSLDAWFAAVEMAEGVLRGDPPGPRQHANRCEAEADHPHDCATATRLAQLTAIVQDVVNEVACPSCGGCADIDPCLHCAAERALEPPR